MYRYISLLAGILFFISGCGRTVTDQSQDERLTDYVNPFIGTGYHGHTFPGAAYPFGQIQLSPDNGTQGWDWCSGYHYSDSVLAGFSHLHLSGTGIGDLADISFLPVSSDVVFTTGEKNNEFVSRYAGKYKHSDESARAGYYSVVLSDGIKAEFTVSERAGMHRYTFPETGKKSILINLGFAINWDKPYSTSLSIADSCLVTGYRLSKGWAADQHVYFAVRFSKPIVKSQITEVGGDGRSVGLFTFSEKVVIAKVGISSVSVENALSNLDSSIQGFDFDLTSQAASDAWEKELSKITD